MNMSLRFSGTVTACSENWNQCVNSLLSHLGNHLSSSVKQGHLPAPAPLFLTACYHSVIFCYIDNEILHWNPNHRTECWRLKPSLCLFVWWCFLVICHLKCICKIFIILRRAWLPSKKGIALLSWLENVTWLQFERQTSVLDVQKRSLHFRIHPWRSFENIIFNLNNIKEVFFYNVFGRAVVYKRVFVAGRVLHLSKTIVG